MKRKCCQFWDHKQEKYELVTSAVLEGTLLKIHAALAFSYSLQVV